MKQFNVSNISPCLLAYYYMTVGYPQSSRHRLWNCCSISFTRLRAFCGML